MTWLFISARSRPSVDCPGERLRGSSNGAKLKKIRGAAQGSWRSNLGSGPSVHRREILRRFPRNDRKHAGVHSRGMRDLSLPGHALIQAPERPWVTNDHSVSFRKGQSQPWLSRSPWMVFRDVQTPTLCLIFQKSLCILSGLCLFQKLRGISSCPGLLKWQSSWSNLYRQVIVRG
jgi:hypothetical protein